MRCMWCQRIIQKKWGLFDLLLFRDLDIFPRCQACEEALHVLEGETSCPCCSRPQESEKRCEDCRRWQDIYPGRSFKNRALFAYEGLGQEWLQTFKYRGDFYLRSFLRQEVQAVYDKYYADQCLVPIPISLPSMNQRGFNQVTAVLDDAGLPYLDLLLNEHLGQKQSSKDRKARMTSPQVFVLKDEARSLTVNKGLVLVDDVYTTGRTLMHAYDCLREWTDQRIEFFTLFR